MKEEDWVGWRGVECSRRVVVVAGLNWCKYLFLMVFRGGVHGFVSAVLTSRLLLHKVEKRLIFLGVQRTHTDFSGLPLITSGKIVR